MMIRTVTAVSVAAILCIGTLAAGAATPTTAPAAGASKPTTTAAASKPASRRAFTPATSIASRPSKDFDRQLTKAAWAYGWTHGIDKVFRTDYAFGGQLGGTLRVELAANEYEGVQLVLRATKPVKDIRVSVSDLAADGGAKLTADQIEILPVGYVNTKEPPYEVEYVGWWADALLNFMKSFDVEANVWQPVWLDVHTKPTQPAGTYRGVVTVTADGMETIKAPLEVTVWDFAVPTTYHFPLAVTFSDTSLKSLYSKDEAEWAKYMAYCADEATLESLGHGEARRLADIRAQCHEMLLDHHLIPDNIYRLYSARVDDVRHWKDRGARWFCLYKVSGQKNVKEGEPYPADEKKKILDALAVIVPKFEKAGLLDMGYIYGFDEIKANQFAAVKDIFGEIKKRYPRIPLMTTAYDYTYGRDSGLDAYVDIWVPVTAKFEKNAAILDEARERGKQIWWYVCSEPRHPYANLHVDYTAPEHRLLMGFMAWKFHSQGFLYYAMNIWKTTVRTTNPDGTVNKMVNVPFTEPLNRGPLTNYDGKAWRDWNGDGQLFYPGVNGPISTIRLKCMRDGLEDYEYLLLLKQKYDQAQAGKIKVSADWLKQASAALAVEGPMIESMTRYSTDGQDIVNARAVIGKLLSEKSSQ